MENEDILKLAQEKIGISFIGNINVTEELIDSWVQGFIECQELNKQIKQKYDQAVSAGKSWETAYYKMKQKYDALKDK